MNARLAADARPRASFDSGVRRIELCDLPEAGPHLLANTLYGARGLEANGLVWHWEAVHPSRIQEWVTFNPDDLQLALDGDAVGLDSAQLDWRDCSGETQLIAWTAVHEPLIGLLRTVFRRDLVPERIEDCDAPPGKSPVRAGFRVYRKEGALVVAGLVTLAACSVPSLADRADALAPRRHSALSGVEAELLLHLDEVEILPDEIACIERGAIVRLDNRALARDPVRISIPAGHVRLIVDVAGLRATVAGFAPLCHPIQNSGDNRMSNSDSPPEEPHTSGSGAMRGAEARVAAEALPVRLTFCAGAVTLPFGKVSDIGPGYVFELDKHLDDRTISVLANDVPIAAGELVTIGDLVGVRITRMLSRT
jgi:flagellar motor switch protein FliN/FliY